MVEKFKSTMQFLSDVNREFLRVVWPSKSELVGATCVVLMLMVFFALYLGIVDFFFARLAARIF